MFANVSTHAKFSQHCACLDTIMHQVVGSYHIAFVPVSVNPKRIILWQWCITVAMEIDK